jgi:hypothetical protein
VEQNLDRIARDNESKREWRLRAEAGEAKLREVEAERDALRERWDDAERRAVENFKEADALREALLRYRNFKPLDQRFDHCGFMNATALSERDIYVGIRAQADAALKGGDRGGSS